MTDQATGRRMTRGWSFVLPSGAEGGSPNDVQATDEMAGQLLGIKRALERVLGGEEAPLAAEASPDLGAENERLRAELTRAREDAAFVLARLDAAEADNLRLGSELAACFRTRKKCPTVSG